MEPKDLNEELGNSDIYLIDQILKNRFNPAGRILDAGCGEGRNMTWFVRNDFNIYGIDNDPVAVKMARLIARSNNRSFTVENIIESSIEDNPFPAGFFDTVLCMNVLHSARDHDHFFQMINSLHRVLNKNGQLLISAYSDPAEGEINVGNEESDMFRLSRDILEELGKVFLIGSVEPYRTLQIEGQENISYIWMSHKNLSLLK